MIKKVYRAFILLLSLFFASTTVPAQMITINEVMFDAVGADDYDEYIEIYNYGEKDVNLQDPLLIINGYVKTIIGENEYSDIIIPKRSFALILDKDYFNIYGSQPYKDRIPEGTYLYTITDNTFGLLNSDSNTIYFVLKNGDTIRSAITIPDQDAGYSEEKIDIYGNDDLVNWGNSSVLYGTPGFENSIAMKDFDLAVVDVGLRDSTEKILAGGTVEFIISIKNIGRNAIIDAVIQFGDDIDRDTILENNEVISMENVTIPAGVSIEFYPKLTNVKSGKHTMLCAIKTEDDNPNNNFKTCVVEVAYRKTCLVINEFMYAPKTNFGGEWIELLNISGDTINLAGWQISDNSSSTEISAADITVPPSEYVLLSSDETIADYWEIEGIYVHCEKSLPTLNNTEDSIVVRDLCGQVIDSLKYSSNWGYQQGRSLERIDPYMPGDISINWALSQNTNGGTPGYNNSVVKKDFDLELSGVDLLDDTVCPRPGSTAELYINIKNTGRETVINADFYLGIDTNQDSVLQENEVLYVDVLTISSGDSVILYPGILVTKSGRNRIIASIVSDDDNNDNNLKFFILNVQYPVNCVAINEFMYVPKADFGGEWIELLNVSEDTINLAGWQIGDNSSSAEISATDIMVPPSEYVLLSSDGTITDYWEIEGIYVHCEKSLPTLNNTEDSIVVRDLCGQVIDSLKYSSSWGYRQGVSLERINPYRNSIISENWSFSQNIFGGTPGYMNSLMIKTHDLSIDTIYIVSEDILHGESVELEFIVANNGLVDISAYSIYLGIKPIPQKPNESIIFDTLLYYETPIQTGGHQKKSFLIESIPGGIFQIDCEVFYSGDEQSSNDQDSCIFAVGYPENCIVVNEVMNVPETGESEWFEMYNTSDIDINLYQWTYRDAGGAWRTMTIQSEIIEPLGFYIIAARTDFRQAYPQFSGNLIVPMNFPILNNSSDSLFLADGSGHLIETVFFRQEWGGTTGVSVERKDPNSSALTEFNWGSSEDPAGATPGTDNSILKYQYDLKIIPGSFKFVDSTVALVRPSIFNIEIVNNGSRESGRYSIEVYHDSNSDTHASPAELVWSLYDIPPLLPDSTPLFDGEIYSEKSGRCHYLAIVAMSEDENTKDNVATTDLSVAYPKQSVIINEFLAYPNPDRAEFVELLNHGGDIINLNGWTLDDSRSTTGPLPSILLENGKFLVLAQDSGFFDYNSVENFLVNIPNKWPGLSNTTDQIILRDLTGTAIDSLAYNTEWGIVQGVSMEKRLPEDPGEHCRFWLCSLDPNGSTPGNDNSITPKLFDIKLDSIQLGHYDGSAETELEICCWISNIGQSDCNSLQILVQENKHTIASENIGKIVSGAQDSITINAGIFESGIHHLQMVVDWPADVNHQNDTLCAEIRTAYPENILRLSEFMANPGELIIDNKSNSEYIEIFNPSAPIQLEGWGICDENTGAQMEIREQKIIYTGEYFIFAADSSVFNFTGIKSSNTIVFEKFPSLNNTADAIYLKDPTGLTIDSLFYNSQWEILKDVSHERVFFNNPNTISNWRYSTDPSGGTPGYKNSVAIEDNTNKLGIKTAPNPFSPNGDGFDDQVAIIYTLPFPSARITVQIYDLVGRLIFEPSKNTVTSAEGAVYWDGSSKYSNRARIGMYVVRCSATDTASDKSVGYITTVVLAR